jgi:hypothetical protein
MEVVFAGDIGRVECTADVIFVMLVMVLCDRVLQRCVEFVGVGGLLSPPVEGRGCNGIEDVITSQVELD